MNGISCRDDLISQVYNIGSDRQIKSSPGTEVFYKSLILLCFSLSCLQYPVVLGSAIFTDWYVVSLVCLAGGTKLVLIVSFSGLHTCGCTLLLCYLFCPFRLFQLFRPFLSKPFVQTVQTVGILCLPPVTICPVLLLLAYVMRASVILRYPPLLFLLTMLVPLLFLLSYATTTAIPAKPPNAKGKLTLRYGKLTLHWYPNKAKNGKCCKFFLLQYYVKCKFTFYIQLSTVLLYLPIPTA
jgi:hypothetical protein